MDSKDKLCDIIKEENKDIESGKNMTNDQIISKIYTDVHIIKEMIINNKKYETDNIRFMRTIVFGVYTGLIIGIYWFVNNV